MELHRLSFLVIASLVSMSAQDDYDPLNGFYDYERGYPNEVSYPHSNNHNHKCSVEGNNEDNYEPYPPIYYIGKNTEDYLTSRDSNGNYKQLKKQQQRGTDSKKLKKLMASVKKVLPPLVRLLQYDADKENYGDNGYSRRGVKIDPHKKNTTHAN